ncbi:MAG: succinyl-diaminopimelate desuccinylase [Gammaproteobacteria bacterium]|nr:succinyl-diaminopimelate desuccinylase [Gammaproteobacteria bacterium]
MQTSVSNHNLSDTVALCQELVRRPSVTPDDQGCQPLIANKLKALGFQLEYMPFGDVTNLWARLGNQTPLFVFAGHTDVVPTGDEALWSVPPFSAELRDDMLIGRGAADMKGSVAAMTIAAKRFVEAHPTFKGSLAFLLTSDEEGPAIDGTAKVVDTLVNRQEQIDYCLVGEPTSENQLGDVIKNGRRGSLGCRLEIQGKQGHVAYPHLAENPIHRAAGFLADLVAIEWDEGDEHFPPTTLQISNMHAGTGATNVIPGVAKVDFNARFNPASPVSDIQSRVEALIEKHDLDANLQWRTSAQPFITEAGSLTNAMRSAIKKITGMDAALETSGGVSDGRFIAPTGAQVIEFGPLNDTIHAVNECVSCRDLDQLTDIYEELLVHLLAG